MFFRYFTSYDFSCNEIEPQETLHDFDAHLVLSNLVFIKTKLGGCTRYVQGNFQRNEEKDMKGEERMKSCKV